MYDDWLFLGPDPTVSMQPQPLRYALDVAVDGYRAGFEHVNTFHPGMRFGGTYDNSCTKPGCAAGPAAASSDYLEMFEGIPSIQPGLGQKLGRVRSAAGKHIDHTLPWLEREHGIQAVVAENDVLLARARMVFDFAVQVLRRSPTTTGLCTMTIEQMHADPAAAQALRDEVNGTQGPRLKSYDTQDHSWEFRVSSRDGNSASAEPSREGDIIRQRLLGGEQLDMVVVELRRLGNDVLFGRSKIKRNAEARPVVATALLTLAAVLEAHTQGHADATIALPNPQVPTSRGDKAATQQARRQIDDVAKSGSLPPRLRFLQDVCLLAVNCVGKSERKANTIVTNASRTRERLFDYLPLLRELVRELDDLDEDDPKESR